VRDLKRLRRACERRLDGLRIPRPFDLDAFMVSVQNQRGGRRIHIQPSPIPASEVSPYGMWVATHDADFIVYEPETTPLHRAQIVLHEVGHMLFDHHSDEVVDPRILSVLFPDLDPAIVKLVLSRHDHHKREDEFEAEMFASLVLETAGYEPDPALTEDGLMDRIGDALGHPMRRRERGI
jgi:hypothetical protein